ncbi:MAG TPA: OmpH family outer membrane protein [Verrucomicrobiae bacterium]|jgi:outer membrane protein|nr:OmpH family outer membrane protein [Verrucomicrobiae bacterium]
MSGRHIISIVALGLGLSASFAGPASAQAAPAGSKIGIVNIQEAIATCNEGKKEFDTLQQKFNPKAAELKNLKDDIDSSTKQLQAQGDKLSDDERASRTRAIDVKQKTYQRNAQDAQDEFQQAEQEVVNRVGTKMLDVLSKYAQDNGYLVVLDVSNPQTPVLFANPGTNITKELVDAYNAQSGVAAPAVKPAGATAPRPTTPAPTTPKKP